MYEYSLYCEHVHFGGTVLDTAQGRRQSVTLTHAGRRVRYNLTVEPLHDSDGRLIGLTGAAIDLSERPETAT